VIAFAVVALLRARGVVEGKTQKIGMYVRHMERGGNLTWGDRCGVAAEFLRQCEAKADSELPALQVWGERHSGTNMMETLLKTNFRQSSRTLYTYGFKHQFEDDQAKWVTEMEDGVRDGGSQVVMTRSLFDWLPAIQAKSYQPNMGKKVCAVDLDSFLQLPWRCFTHGETCFENILQLRGAKFRAFVNTLGPVDVERREGKANEAGAIFVRYEDLERDAGVNVTCRLVNALGLCPIDDYVEPIQYNVKAGGVVDSGHSVEPKSVAELRTAVIERWNATKEGKRALEIVSRGIDWDAEEYMGYHTFDIIANNSNFFC